MEYKTKEMLITVESGNIIHATLHSHVEQVTIEGAKENINAFKKIASTDKKEKGLINWIPSFYVSKDVIRYYNEEFNNLPINLIAIVITSFPSRFVTNIFLKIRERTVADKGKSIKTFNSKEGAVTWLQTELASPNRNGKG